MQAAAKLQKYFLSTDINSTVTPPLGATNCSIIGIIGNKETLAYLLALVLILADTHIDIHKSVSEHLNFFRDLSLKNTAGEQNLPGNLSGRFMFYAPLTVSVIIAGHDRRHSGGKPELSASERRK